MTRNRLENTAVMLQHFLIYKFPEKLIKRTFAVVLKYVRIYCKKKTCATSTISPFLWAMHQSTLYKCLYMYFVSQFVPNDKIMTSKTTPNTQRSLVMTHNWLTICSAHSTQCCDVWRASATTAADAAAAKDNSRTHNCITNICNVHYTYLYYIYLYSCLWSRTAFVHVRSASLQAHFYEIHFMPDAHKSTIRFSSIQFRKFCTIRFAHCSV